MMSANLALREAIVTALLANTDVVAAINGTRIYDDVPRKAAFPYVVFADAFSRDLSTDDGNGEEHIVRLAIWSRGRGSKEIDVIAAAVRTALHDQDLALNGHRLVNLRFQTLETRRESDGETRRASIQFRAVTEVVGGT